MSTQFFLRNWACNYIADHNLQSAVRIIFAYLRNPLIINGVPQVGTPLYSLTRLVKKGNPHIPAEIINAIHNYSHSNFYEAGIEARRLLHQLKVELGQA